MICLNYSALQLKTNNILQAYYLFKVANSKFNKKLLRFFPFFIYLIYEVFKIIVVFFTLRFYRIFYL